MKNVDLCGNSFPVCEEFDADKMAGGVDNFGKGDASLMAAAKQERIEEEAKRKKDDMKRQLDCDEYDQESDALNVRHAKAQAAAKTKALKETTTENNRFASEGGDVKEHREVLEKIQEACNKELTAANAKYDSDRAILRRKNPNGYSSSRRY